MGRGDEWRFAMVAARLSAIYDDPDNALRRYGARLRNAPQDPLANFGYALALAETGNRGTAIEHMTVALRQRAFDGYMLGDMGRLLYLDGQSDKARSALEGAVGLAPENAEGQLYLARVLKDQGQLRTAQQILETIVAARPEYSAARYQLGELYGAQGNLADAHLNLGIYFKEKGDLKNGRFHLQRAVAAASDPEKRKSAEALLRELTKEERDAKAEAERQGRSLTAAPRVGTAGVSRSGGVDAAARHGL
jgi:predicted Zn-dependent protease